MDAAFVLLLCLFVGSLKADDCPPKEDVLPCDCTRAGDLNYVECTSIHNPEELVPPMQALRRSKTRVYSLRIINSTLSDLPDNLFQDTHIKWVRFVMTKTTYLSENRTAFIGLENVLEKIGAYDVDFVTGLQLDQFRNLTKLEGIIFKRCRMDSAVGNFPHLPKLANLQIMFSEISHIANTAFRDLPNLSTFDMRYNKVTEMNRSMFPNPAEHLQEINLWGNRLSSLPEDFFENMPDLRYVYLNDNKFVTIAEKPFSDVFSKNLLQYFDMAGNPLHCDCKLSWMENVSFPLSFMAKCVTPDDFAGIYIRALDFESLRCQSGQ